MQQVVEEGEVVRLAGERAPNLGVSEVAPAEYVVPTCCTSETAAHYASMTSSSTIG